MQRLRETIRGWAADPTIRDVSLLLDTRRAIEHEMVRQHARPCMHVPREASLGAVCTTGCLESVALICAHVVMPL